ncbi:MAG: MGMT family protein [Nocardioides sp.]|jgi:methylated-DNA-protein-cysteine methyltransferase-like protein
MNERTAELVLRAVELVPRGRVVSYGDLADLVGTGPRHVGMILRERGDGLAWWRVCNAYGDPPKHKRDEVLQIWRSEGIEIKPNGLGCRIHDFRVDLVRLAAEWERATLDIRTRED